MPPRLNKRQLRELQELEDLDRARAHSGAASPAPVQALPTEDEVESSDEDGIVVGQQGSKGGFGAVRYCSLRLCLPELC